MLNLARAVVSTIAAIRFSGEQAIDSDFAVEMMEMLEVDLHRCTEAEKEALLQVTREELEARRASGASEEVLAFYRTFVSEFVEGSYNESSAG